MSVVENKAKNSSFPVQLGYAGVVGSERKNSLPAGCQNPVARITKAKEILKNPRPAGSWRPLKCIFSGKKELRVKIAPRRKIFAEIRPKQAAAIRVVSARGNLRLT